MSTDRRLRRGAGGQPAEFTLLLWATDEMQMLFEWAGATTPVERALVFFGFTAQAIFMARWLVQWLASERRRASVIPAAFWWLSLIGASLLLVYYLLRREPVGLLGQSFGWVVYARNLWLRRAAAGGESNSAGG